MRRAIEYFNPDYLAIGIEVNIMLAKSPEKWSEYMKLHEYIYRNLKKEYPHLILFASVQYEFLRGVDNEAKHNVEVQSPNVKKMLNYSDILALSTYKYGIYHNPLSFDYFQKALSFGKTVAIAEMGAMSENTRIFSVHIKANRKDQKKFVKTVLENAQQHNFLFVINFVSIDYDKMISKLPDPIDEIAKAWVHSGMQTYKRKDKDALKTWRYFFKQPFVEKNI